MSRAPRLRSALPPLASVQVQRSSISPARSPVPTVAEPAERQVLTIAQEISRLGGGMKAGAYRMSRITRVMMTLAMRFPEFQTDLFRFVDVFPAMRDDRDTVEHLIEYFDQSVAASVVGAPLKAAAVLPAGRKIVTRIARQEITRMAEQFIVGQHPADVAAEVGKMWRGGTAATIDLLGEHTFSHSEADRYASRLTDLLDSLLGASEQWPANERLELDDLGGLPRVAASIKPSALAPDFAPLTAEAGIDSERRRLLPILTAAARRGAQVWFDMERYDTKDLTHRLFRDLLAEPELERLHAGIVVQAYLKDSAQDLAQLIEWATAAHRRVPIAVRLVKGAYWDTETIVAEAAGWSPPVYEHKAETDLNYEHCTRMLHGAHGVVRSGFASHNLRSLAYAIAAGRQAGIPDNGYEIQLLHGMAEPVHEAIRQLGFRLRVYAPMGELVPGMAYLVRRLLENTSQESFVRHRFAEGKDLDKLLAKPKLPRSARGGPVARVRRRTPAPAAASLESARAGRRATSARFPREYRPEPLAEWFRPEVRQQMAEAVGRQAGVLDFFVPARINGRDVQTSRTITSVNPADPASTLATSACAGIAEADEAIRVCAAGFDEWSRRPAAARASVLFGAAAWMRENRFDIAALEVFEAGKCWDDADGDVCEAIDYLEYYGRQAIVLGRGGTVQSPPGEENRLSYRGRGVAVVIAPWNFPLAIPTGMVAGALVAGNSVVLKPAEQTPAIAAVLAKALAHSFVQQGLPEGVFAFLPGIGEEIGDHLVTHRDVTTVAFTGSKAVGLHLNETAARVVPGQREVRRVLAEMGGKNALVIDSDADLDVAVPAAVRSAFGYAGQRCSATSRIITIGGVHDPFLERFVEATRALAIGSPQQMGTELGPVIDEDAMKRILQWQERAAGGEWGNVVLQRDELPERGYFVGPTIVDNVSAASRLAQEEIFGPVVAVMRAADLDEAVKLASSVEYALTAGLISRWPSHIRQASEFLRAGNSYINRGTIGAVVGRQPFGGFGMSGLGQKAGGPDYLYQFVDPRVVTENTMRQGFAPAASEASPLSR